MGHESFKKREFIWDLKEGINLHYIYIEVPFKPIEQKINDSYDILWKRLNETILTIT